MSSATEAALGDIADWGSGGTPSRSVREYFGEGLPWLSIADLNDGLVRDSKESLTQLGIEHSSAKPVPPGTVLVAMYGSIGKLGIATRELCTSQAIAFAIPNQDRVDTRYLFHFLLSERPRLQARGRGGTQSNIGQGDLKAWRIPLPPLPEQRRIAAILDAADALRAKRRTAIAKLDELTQSIFLDMFGDPATNPKGWEESSLRDLGAKFRYGTSVKSAAQGRPTLRIPNVVRGSIDLSDLKLVPLDDREFERLRLQDGDILFVRTNGNPDYVGRCALFETKELSKAAVPREGFAYASYLIRARIPAERVNAVFLREYFSSAEGRRRMKSRSKTSAGQYNINIDGLGSFAVPLPPAKLQRDFAVQVDATARLRAAENSALAGVTELFASLQQRAFRGEL